MTDQTAPIPASLTGLTAHLRPVDPNRPTLRWADITGLDDTQAGQQQPPATSVPSPRAQGAVPDAVRAAAYDAVAKSWGYDSYADVNSVQDAEPKWVRDAADAVLAVVAASGGLEPAAARVGLSAADRELIAAAAPDAMPDPDRPLVVAICGSTRFRDQMATANRELTLEGHIVVAPGVFAHSGDTITDDQKTLLDDLHKRKIDLADAVYVVNPGGYIGDSTRSEIAYAVAAGKPVRYLEPLDADPDAVPARPTVTVHLPAEYLIWSHHHRTWFAPNGCGYRSDITDAGRYTLDDTKQWLGRGCGCCPVPEVVIPAPGPEVLAKPGRTATWVAEQVEKATQARIAAGDANTWAGDDDAAGPAIVTVAVPGVSS